MLSNHSDLDLYFYTMVRQAYPRMLPTKHVNAILNQSEPSVKSYTLQVTGLDLYFKITPRSILNSFELLA